MERINDATDVQIDEVLEIIASKLAIPVIPDMQSIWFFRTKGGQLYFDFSINNFIGLGWDKISKDIILDKKISEKEKKERIEEKYPEKSRPGLILSQLDVFYNQMKIGDFILIPSHGTDKIHIGKLGDLVANVEHKDVSIPYRTCDAKHMRSVTWIKEFNLGQDIYLFKALRAQQTISNISKTSNLVLRNMFSCYVTDEEIHFTVHKQTNTNYSLSSSYELTSAIMGIVTDVSVLYEQHDARDRISIRTAVGSPGFLEIILPALPVCYVIAKILEVAFGKYKGSTGVAAIFSAFNDGWNDYHNRKMTDAQTKLIEAKTETERFEAQKKAMEAEKIKAEIDKIQEETHKLQLENQKNEICNIYIPSQIKIERHLPTIQQNVDKIRTEAAKANIYCNENDSEKVS